MHHYNILGGKCQNIEIQLGYKCNSFLSFGRAQTKLTITTLFYKLEKPITRNSNLSDQECAHTCGKIIGTGVKVPRAIMITIVKAIESFGDKCY